MSLLTTSSSVVQEIFPKNTARISFTMKNTDNTNSIYVKKERSEKSTVSASDFDHILGPGGSLSLNNTQDGKQAIQERWTCLSSAANPVLAWFETEDINR